MPAATHSELKNANTATTKLTIPVTIAARSTKPMIDENLLSIYSASLYILKELEH
jgi:hypothetical protein